MLTTGYQLAAARALIGMDQVELASKVGLSANTIRNMEASKANPIAGRSQNVGAVQRALEAAGVEFLNHGHPGVRLKPPTIHPRPFGPATDVVDTMDNAISKDRARLASVKETGEEVPQEEWQRFEAANKKPT